MSATTIELLLWQTCSVFACLNPVAVTGDVCGDCRTAFGDMIQGTEPAPAGESLPETESEDDTDSGARRNQTCWMCEERHTCTRTSNGWECKACMEVR